MALNKNRIFALRLADSFIDQQLPTSPLPNEPFTTTRGPSQAFLSPGETRITTPLEHRVRLAIEVAEWLLVDANDTIDASMLLPQSVIVVQAPDGLEESLREAMGRQSSIFQNIKPEDVIGDQSSEAPKEDEGGDGPDLEG